MISKGNYIGDGQKCWTCQNTVNGCEWSESKAKVPVPGWDADYVPLGEDYTWDIKDCPKYEFKDESCDDCVYSNGKRDRSQYDRCGMCAYHPDHKGIGDSLKEVE